MKVKVLIDYVDKYTYVWHKVGEIVEMTEERFDEINRKRQFVQAIQEKKPKRKKKKVEVVEETTETEETNETIINE